MSLGTTTQIIQTIEMSDPTFCHSIATCCATSVRNAAGPGLPPRGMNLRDFPTRPQVTMNNTLCLGLFLLVVSAQHLDWVYSSEVTAIVGAPAHPAVQCHRLSWYLGLPPSWVRKTHQQRGAV